MWAVCNVIYRIRCSEAYVHLVDLVTFCRSSLFAARRIRLAGSARPGRTGGADLTSWVVVNNAEPTLLSLLFSQTP